MKSKSSSVSITLHLEITKNALQSSLLTHPPTLKVLIRQDFSNQQPIIHFRVPQEASVQPQLSFLIARGKFVLT